MFLKIQNLNYLLIFLVILITFIGAAGLYSAAGGSYNPWASRHLTRLVILLSLANNFLFSQDEKSLSHDFNFFWVCFLSQLAIHYTLKCKLS